MVQDRSIEQQFQQLCREYAQELPQKLAGIEETWNVLEHRDWNSDDLRQLHRMVHSLAGSGASFGFSDVSESARTLAVLLQSLMHAEQAADLRQRREIEHHLLVLRECLQQSGKPSEEGADTFEPVVPAPEGDKTPMIYIVGCGAQDAQHLSSQICHFGYETMICESASDYQEYLKRDQPSALIAEAVHSEEQAQALRHLSDLRAATQTKLPILFVSTRDDLEARLQAVRAGASAYFTKPVDIGKLVDKLDELTAARQSEPYRVLVVDDEVSLASHHALILQRAGMLTASVSDPTQVMQQLADLRPDLILVDVYMPICTGVEIASVIRQMDAYVGIPIVFLSTEVDTDKQLEAMHFGADDFLTKPILPSHLIAAVTMRAERSRKLRTRMARDSLTGLLNHSHTKDQLAVEVIRAERHDSTLAFAMLDLDHFKQVNDSYGHVAGDYVLKNLARMLQQRLRRTDIVGRYGGEEFAVILADAGGLAAVQLMDELRIGFSQLRHQWNGIEFTVSFSCGVAVYPACPDMASLIETADNALYAAKQGGRNRVVLRGGCV